MVDEIVSETGPLTAFARAHSNSLFDVVALLEAAADRIEAATPNSNTAPDAADAMHNTLRLVQMASKKAKSVAELMFEKL